MSRSDELARSPDSGSSTVETARPGRFVEVDDALPREAHARLVAAITAVLPRVGEGFDLGEAGKPLETLLEELCAVVRRELGVAHFRLEGVSHYVTLHTADGARHDSVAPEEMRGTRRVEFVYTIARRPEGFAGGAVRLFDTVTRDGVPCAATFAELPRRDNALLLFPSDCHHEVSKTRVVSASTEQDDGSFVCTISGWLAGDPVVSGLPDVDTPTIEALQVRYLPRLTERGFEIRPIPDAVHRLLSGLLALRSARARPEDADRDYHLGGDPEIVPVDDVTDEILRRLQPLHEAWCGLPLVPVHAYGMRRYRVGSRLAMHVDRAATHVVSSVLQVAQDVDSPWPFQLDLDGRRESILLEPGQMLLYEGATTPHGRITPLDGRDFVNLFVHYRPVEWTWSADALVERALADGLIDRTGRLRS